MAVKERHSLDLHGVGWLMAGRVPGAAIGVALLAVVTQKTLDLFIGVFVLMAVVVLAWGLHIPRNRGTQFAAGVASGTTSLVTSIGGPPTALLYTSAEAATIRSTLATVFTIGISFTAIVRTVTGNFSSTDLKVALLLFPAVLLGWLVSLRYKDRFSTSTVRIGVLLVSGAAGIGLILRAVSA
jgi:uncharacterized membrane protein YfcA